MAVRGMGAKIQPWGTGHFDNRFVSTHRAFHQTAQELRLKVVLRAEPAFKRMLLATLKIQDFHVR